MYPTNLAFNACINPSNFAFYTKKEGKLKPIHVSQSTVLGTKSERMKEKNMTDFENGKVEILHDRSSANIARLDVCYLPLDAENLFINGNITFTNIYVNSCNDPSYRTLLDNFINNIEKTDIQDLAERYFMNIINGRMAQRNLSLSENTKVHLTLNNETFTFNSDNYLNSIDFNEMSKNESEENLIFAQNFVQSMIDTFLNKQRVLHVQVSIELTIDSGQKVFPSQEFTENKKDDVGTILASENGHAILHTQKIGNAIRTIDNYHDQGSIIAVEPYGSAVREFKIYRNSGDITKNDAHLYAYLNKIDKLKHGSNQTKFVIANFIRGGVFGGA